MRTYIKALPAAPAHPGVTLYRNLRTEHAISFTEHAGKRSAI